MDNFGLILILVLIVLIFISAFFSGSETSITAINQIKLDSAAESGQKSAKMAQNSSKRLKKWQAPRGLRFPPCLQSIPAAGA